MDEGLHGSIMDIYLEGYKAGLRTSCILRGCIYGLPIPGTQPGDTCIVCGEPRPKASPFFSAGAIEP